MKSKILLLAIVLTVWLTASWNHFDDGFYFDDVQTISNNEFVPSLKCFTGIQAFGTMSENRGHSPLVVLLNVIDHRLTGKELNQVVSHISIWLWHLTQGVLMFILIQKVFELAMLDMGRKITALLTTVFRMFHSANAETINCINMSVSFNNDIYSGNLPGDKLVGNDGWFY